MPARRVMRSVSCRKHGTDNILIFQIIMKKAYCHKIILLLLCIMVLSGIAQAKEYTKEQIIVIQEQAENGITDAQIDLGFIYYNGHGVSIDKSTAAHWFLKAAEQGHAYAQHYIA